MTASLIQIIQHLRPGLTFRGFENDYNSIASSDGSPLPAPEEIAAARPEVEAALEAAAQIPAVRAWPSAGVFLAEFSLEETAAISLSGDPTVAALRLILAAWPDDVLASDSRVQAGLSKLVELGILTAERKAEIDGGL